MPKFDFRSLKSGEVTGTLTQVQIQIRSAIVALRVKTVLDCLDKLLIEAKDANPPWSLTRAKLRFEGLYTMAEELTRSSLSAFVTDRPSADLPTYFTKELVKLITLLRANPELDFSFILENSVNSEVFQRTAINETLVSRFGTYLEKVVNRFPGSGG